MKLISFTTFLFISFIVSVSYGQSLMFAAKEKDKKFGYINDRGEYVIAPAFDHAGVFYQGIAVVKKGKKFGVINVKGEFVVQPTYDKADFYAPEGKVTVMKDGKWGVIDQSGKVIIPLIHEYMSVFVNGYVVAGTYITGKSYKGLICPIVLDGNNKEVLRLGKSRNNNVLDTLSYDSWADYVWPDYLCTQLYLPGSASKKNNVYSNGWPIVREDKLVLNISEEGGPSQETFIELDLKTHKSIKFPYGWHPADDYFGFREGLIAIESPEYLKSYFGDILPDGFYDTTSADYSEPKKQFDTLNAERVHPYFNGVAAIEKDKLWMFVDRQGAIIGETNLSTAEYHSYPPMYFNGLIAFWKNGKAGYVDIQGKEIIPFNFEEFHPFENEVTPVKQNGLYGLLRKDGSWAVSPRFVTLDTSPCPCYQ